MLSTPSWIESTLVMMTSVGEVKCSEVVSKDFVRPYSGSRHSLSSSQISSEHFHAGR